MNVFEDNIYHDAIVAGGMDLQLRVVMEECLELALALLRMKRGRATAIDVAEEVADVEIMTQQIRCMIGDAIIDEQKALKLKRLRKRIEENNMENDEPLTKGECYGL